MKYLWTPSRSIMIYSKIVRLPILMLQWLLDSWLNVHRHEPKESSWGHGLCNDTRKTRYVLWAWRPMKCSMSVSSNNKCKKIMWQSCTCPISEHNHDSLPTHAQTYMNMVCSTSNTRYKMETALNQRFKLRNRANTLPKHANPLINTKRMKNV